MNDLDRMAATGGGDQRRLHQFRHRPRVECGRHRQQEEIRPQRAGTLEAECQSQIGVERAFMKFVEENRSDPLQRGVGLQHPGQDPFGDDLDPGPGRDLRVTAHAISDRVAGPLAQHSRHPFRRRSRCQPTRFQKQDAVRGQACPQQRERHDGGLPHAGRRLKDGTGVSAQGLQKRREDIFDGQLRLLHGLRLSVRRIENSIAPIRGPAPRTPPPDPRGIWNRQEAKGVRASFRFQNSPAAGVSRPPGAVSGAECRARRLSGVASRPVQGGCRMPRARRA